MSARVRSAAPGQTLPRTFLDTNLLVYCDDPRDGAKQAQALEWVKLHLRARSGVVSVQVLQEYFVTITGKLRIDAALARQRVAFLAHLQVVEPTADDVLSAIDLQRLRGFSYWDAAILHAARRSGCRVLLTEDLQDGQIVEGVLIQNPFLSDR